MSQVPVGLVVLSDGSARKADMLAEVKGSQVPVGLVVLSDGSGFRLSGIGCFRLKSLSGWWSFRTAYPYIRKRPVKKVVSSPCRVGGPFGPGAIGPLPGDRGAVSSPCRVGGPFGPGSRKLGRLNFAAGLKSLSGWWSFRTGDVLPLLAACRREGLKSLSGWWSFRTSYDKNGNPLEKRGCLKSLSGWWSFRTPA